MLAVVENTDTMSAPIVVGVDGSERSHDAVVLAARLAGPGQELLLVHVHPYGRLANLLSGGEQEQLVREVAESTAMVVLGTLEPCASRSMRLVSNRSPAAGLQAMAAEVGAPLIVVGSSHRAGLGRVLPGSVAESVLTEAPAAVAVAPNGYARSEGGLRSSAAVSTTPQSRMRHSAGPHPSPAVATHASWPSPSTRRWRLAVFPRQARPATDPPTRSFEISLDAERFGR
jgi:nucleotide-binding universal stress UspA family protein